MDRHCLALAFGDIDALADSLQLHGGRLGIIVTGGADQVALQVEEFDFAHALERIPFVVEHEVCMNGRVDGFRRPAAFGNHRVA